MIIGSKCNLIERELQERERLCREVVDTTKTTTRLNEKALGFDEKEQKVGYAYVLQSSPNNAYLFSIILCITICAYVRTYVCT